jgi:hypothetical protein
VAVVGLIAAGIAVMGASPAFAVNEINIVECNFAGPHSGYFVIQDNNAGPKIYRCFANAGQMDVNSTHFGGFFSGDNAGWFEYEPGDGWRYRHYFAKFEEVDRNYNYLGTLHIN